MSSSELTNRIAATIRRVDADTMSASALAEAIVEDLTAGDAELVPLTERDLLQIHTALCNRGDHLNADPQWSELAERIRSLA